MNRVLNSFSLSSIRRRAIAALQEVMSTSATPLGNNELRRILLRLVTIRVVILSLILGCIAWEARYGSATPLNLPRICGTLAATFLVSLFNIYLVRRTTHPASAGYVQLGIDVCLATVAVSVAASAVGISLYLLTVIAAAVVFSKRGAVILAALCGLSYAILASNSVPFLSIPGNQTTATSILTVYLSLVTVALVSGSLARRLENLGLAASESAKSLNEMGLQQRQLLDDISEGVMTLDLESTITGINQAAKAIFGLSTMDSDQVIGLPLSGLLDEEEWLDAVKVLQNTNKGSSELSLRPTGSSNEVRIACSVRSLQDSEGKEIGRIARLRDISHIRTIEERLNLHEEMAKLLAESEKQERNRNPLAAVAAIVGSSQLMEKVLQLVGRVANSEASVLVTGESGTGKELIARAIHTQSSRRSEPFIAINCGAIPEGLIESELFGHKRGAFTGAVSEHTGLFRQANKGTIFLDEVGELSPLMQTKLLRVLQERQVRAVGDVKDVELDVRVIAATNCDLKRSIATGQFREDLYYRLNVVNIFVPPLRERREDIPLLVSRFVAKFSAHKTSLPQISPEAMQLLVRYPFPGNVRELENIVERALVLGGLAILPEHLPEEVIHSSYGEHLDSRDSYSYSTQQGVAPSLPMDLEAELARIERMYLTQALSNSHGVKKRAAELLGLNFRSFRYRVKKYGLDDDDSDLEERELNG